MHVAAGPLAVVEIAGQDLALHRDRAARVREERQARGVETIVADRNRDAGRDRERRRRRVVGLGDERLGLVPGPRAESGEVEAILLGLDLAVRAPRRRRRRTRSGDSGSPSSARTARRSGGRCSGRSRAAGENPSAARTSSPIWTHPALRVPDGSVPGRDQPGRPVVLVSGAGRLRCARGVAVERQRFVRTKMEVEPIRAIAVLFRRRDP